MCCRGRWFDVVWLVPSCEDNPIVPSDVGIGLERLFPYLLGGHCLLPVSVGRRNFDKCVPWSVLKFRYRLM